MKTIYKYPIITPIGNATIDIHEDAQFLAVQMQDNVPCIWAVIDTSKPIRSFNVLIAGTGNSLPIDLGGYIGTYQNGWFVGHVFIKPIS